MRSLVYLCTLFALTPLASSAAPAILANQLKVTFDRPNATYRTGETAKFTVQYLGDAPEGSKISWTLGPEGMPAAANGEFTISKEPKTLTGTLKQPGFMNLKVKAVSGTTVVERTSGVAFSPTEIAPSMPVPDDFDAFWEAQKQRLVKIPANPRLTPENEPQFPAVDIFDVQLDSVGKGVSGYFAKPKNAKPKSLPIILTVHGAGVRGSVKTTPINWAQRGFLAMDINAHGIPNGKDEAYYKALADGELKDYRSVGIKDREEAYFVKMFLRDLRAVQFLCDQPEWDGKTVVVYGTSQGGYQAIATGYLDPRVTFVMAGVPAGCDHTGMKAQRIAGWPKIVPTLENGTPDPAILEVSRYIDNVNFATKTKAKGAFFTAGFVDFVCPPTGVYAAYNALPIRKQIYDDIFQAHAPSKFAYELMSRAVMDHLAAQNTVTK